MEVGTRGLLGGCTEEPPPSADVALLLRAVLHEGCELQEHEIERLFEGDPNFFCSAALHYCNVPCWDFSRSGRLHDPWQRSLLRASLLLLPAPPSPAGDHCPAHPL